MENESDGNLVHLPPELLLLVFSNIPARHLMNNVRRVCSKFNRLLSNRQWWQIRINTSPEQIRLSTSELSSNDFDAARTYVEIEEERNRWKAWRKQEKRIGDSCGHIATVDALRIFKSSNGQRFCLSGGRDRSIKLWDLNKIQENENKLSWVSVDKQGAHGGWIWCIDRPSQTEDQFLSCAWDCTIKLWKLTSSDITELGSSKVGSAATSIISSRDGLAMCSTFLRKVCLIDIKNGLDVVASYSHHAGPVFSLAKKDDYIYSCGEDRRIIIVDRRNISAPVAETILPHYAQSLSLHHNQLICGTYRGGIFMMQPDSLKIIHKFRVSPGVPVRQVMHTRGAVLGLSRNRKMKVYSPGVQPVLLAESPELDSEPSRFDYFDGNLAIGGGDGAILFWPYP